MNDSMKNLYMKFIEGQKLVKISYTFVPDFVG